MAVIQAAVIWEPGKQLELEEVELAGVGPGEVRVKVAYSGVCHSDLSIKNGTLGFGMFPGVLGHEGAGVVAEVGEGVTGLREGDHVILSWITPCGRCSACIKGQSFACPTGLSGFGTARYRARGVDVYSSVGLGTFGEECVVPQNAAIKIDADVPMDVAALIGCGVMTGAGSVWNVAQLRPGSSAVIVGCGGVGISAIQGARIAGAAEILAVDRVAEKLELAKRFGASHTTTPEGLADAVRDITGGEGFDYGFEALGRAETVKMAWDATRLGGLVVIIGVGPDLMSLIPQEEFGSKALVTTIYGGAEVRLDFHRIIRLWKTGRIDLEGMITRQISLAQVNEAFDDMEHGQGIRSVITY
jgi:S-(hydroxymethyl)glutathione dehydrogenase/alcohol dehydrogenase